MEFVTNSTPMAIRTIPAGDVGNYNTLQNRAKFINQLVSKFLPDSQIAAIKCVRPLHFEPEKIALRQFVSSIRNLLRPNIIFGFTYWDVLINSKNIYELKKIIIQKLFMLAKDDLELFSSLAQNTPIEHKFTENIFVLALVDLYVDDRKNSKNTSSSFIESLLLLLIKHGVDINRFKALFNVRNIACQNTLPDSLGKIIEFLIQQNKIVDAYEISTRLLKEDLFYKASPANVSSIMAFAKAGHYELAIRLANRSEERSFLIANILRITPNAQIDKNEYIKSIKNIANADPSSLTSSSDRSLRLFLQGAFLADSGNYHEGIQIIRSLKSPNELYDFIQYIFRPMIERNDISAMRTLLTQEGLDDSYIPHSFIYKLLMEKKIEISDTSLHLIFPLFHYSTYTEGEINILTHLFAHRMEAVFTYLSTQCLFRIPLGISHTLYLNINLIAKALIASHKIEDAITFINTQARSYPSSYYFLFAAVGIALNKQPGGSNSDILTHWKNRIDQHSCYRTLLHLESLSNDLQTQETFNPTNLKLFLLGHSPVFILRNFELLVTLISMREDAKKLFYQIIHTIEPLFDVENNSEIQNSLDPFDRRVPPNLLNQTESSLFQAIVAANKDTFLKQLFLIATIIFEEKGKHKLAMETCIKSIITEAKTNVDPSASSTNNDDDANTTSGNHSSSKKSQDRSGSSAPTITPGKMGNGEGNHPDASQLQHTIQQQVNQKQNTSAATAVGGSCTTSPTSNGANGN